MSAVDPFTPGSSLLTFKLGERVTGSVWRGEDTRNGKKVAVKILSRQLPKDAAKRDALVRDVRLGAALYHPSLVSIQEIAAAGDVLLLIMEWLEGMAISTRVRGRPLDRTEFFRFAYQIADAMRFVHSKNVVHGNIAGDSVMIMPSGQAKLCGLNLNNLISRPGQPSLYQQRGNDARAVAYMAPEQISNQPATPQSDIYSLGLVLYEAATGRLAYQGANAAEIAHKLVDEQPPSPKTINPNIDNAVLGVMGRCLFKDPFRRHKEAKAILEDITRADPEAAKFATEVAKSAVAPAASSQPQPQQQVVTRNSILFLADIADYEKLRASDQSFATKSAARMQQLLSEAVYLFDGQVNEHLGPQLIAELPNVEAAVEAARKGEFDFSPAQQGNDPLPVRLLLHAGEIQVGNGQVGGAGVSKGLEVLQNIAPLKVHISEEFLKKGRPKERLRDFGARAGVKLYTIVAPEPPPPAVEVDEEAEEAAAAAEAAAEAAAAAAAAAARRKRQIIMAAIAAVVVIVIGGVVLFSKTKTNTDNAALMVSRPKLKGPAPATAETPRKIVLQPFSVEGTDPALSERAKSVRLTAMEILRGFPEVRVADDVTPDATAFTATVRTGTAGPEIVTGTTTTPMVDAASGIQSIVQHVSSDLKLPQRTLPNSAAVNSFADAVTANAASDAPKTESGLRAATKAEPSFLAAEMMAMRFFAAHGKDNDAVAAAKQVMAADPKNVEAARTVARASLKSGDLSTAFASYGAILKQDPTDVESLNVIGRYAGAANDTGKFNAVLQRLSRSPAEASIHEPDLLLNAGKIDDAVDKYYGVEERAQNNPALALKIGRIAVLRHSTSIAEVELKKLQQTDPNYGLHILKAYIAAQSGSRLDADNELKAALAASKPGDDYYTNVAEVAVISGGGDPKVVLEALQKATDRKEPTASYIIANPLFAFLRTDPDFQKLYEKITAQQTEIRAALSTVPL